MKQPGRTRGRKPGGRWSWPQSAAGRANGRAAITAYNATRDELPKCGATAKSTGEPCQRIAMANGRCHLHGGKTPKGERWHLPQWPDRSSPRAEAKLNAKLADRQRAARQRDRRLAAMTSKERAALEKWVRAHRPGKAAARKRAREQKADAEWFANVTAASPKPEQSPEAARLEEAKQMLLSRLAKRQARTAEPEPDQPPAWDVFS